MDLWSFYIAAGISFGLNAGNFILPENTDEDRCNFFY